MLDLPNYAITDVIYRGPKVDVYRGVRQADNLPVVVKLLKDQYPDLNDIARLRHEYQLVSELNIDGIVRAYGLEKYHNGLALILEAFGHESLKESLGKRLPTLTEFLKIAVQLSDTLGHLHSHKVIHKDLKPANIILDRQTGRVKITDFGISSILAREDKTVTTPHHLQGTLPYMSPEQTGRMNRSLDYRTDFYSLGVTFYELLTGRRPFETQDPIELVHCHLAKQPRSLAELAPGIPPVIHDIVHKLLAKNAEDRYQSAFGLKADLERCRSQWESQGDIDRFAIGQQDRSGQLRIAQKLYGRQQEVQALLESFERVSQAGETGHIEVVTVKGYSGIGKSSLVNEIQIPVTRQRGYFIVGKGDPLKRDIPYHPIRQAFEALIDQLLTEKTAQLEQWRLHILKALGNSAQAIVAVIPPLELILGSQPALPDLPPLEAQNRFTRLFAKLVQVFARKAHPLVIFLDDLQWADIASLKLLEQMTLPHGETHLLLIGAYRDNEVSLGHPLVATLNAIAAQGYAPVDLAVAPLTPEAVLSLVSDALPESDPVALGVLVDLLYQKTQGNPFFVTQILTTLYNAGQLRFDFDAGHWQWDLDQIQTVGITDLDLIDLIVSNLKRLAPETQAILKIAACVGTRFELNMLATMTDESPLTLARTLMPALQQSMILPVNFEVQTSMALTEDDLRDAPLSSTQWIYRFLHDRVHQAAYSLVTADQRASIHARLGQLLLAQTPDERRSDVIFDVVNQLNAGMAVARTIIDRATLIQLNLEAAQKAKRAAAYDPAFNYTNSGLALITEQDWDIDYPLTLAIHQEAAEVAYLTGRFEASDGLTQQLLHRAQSHFDSAAAYDIQIRTRIAQKQLADAIAIGLETLKLFSIDLPGTPTQAAVGEALFTTAQLLASRDITDLGNLPQMSDPQALTAMQVMGRMASSAYIVRPNLYVLLITAMVRLSLAQGNAPLSSFAYASYGLLMCGVTQDIEMGYQLGKAALTLVEAPGGEALKNRVIFLVANFINPWRCHPHESLPLFQSSLQLGLETGDWEFVAWCYWRDVHLLYLTGYKLSDLLGRLQDAQQFVAQIKQAAALNLIALQTQVVVNLSHETSQPTVLVGDYYDEFANLTQYEATGNLLGCYELHLHKLMLAYWLGNYDAALTSATEAAKVLLGVTAASEVALLYFYDSLIRLARYNSDDATSQAQTLEIVTQNQQKLEYWANHAPMNHQHKYDLVAAELARVQGNDDRALALYNAAIEAASQQGYVQEVAMAYELSGELNLKLGHERIGITYLTNAFHTYARWGAMTKVRLMEMRYPQWLSQAIILRDPLLAGETITASTASSTAGSANFDLLSVIRASQAIADEIVLENLLSQLIKLAVENAGAQIGYLILQQDDQWLLQAARGIEPDGTETMTVLQEIPFESETLGTLLSVAIAHYVMRTKQTVMLNNATVQGQFVNDPYVLAERPKSILCSPLLYKGQLRGVIYLENRLTTGAFTGQRLEILNLLSGQAAISLENALLYREQEKLNQNLAELNQAYERFVPSQFLKLLNKDSIVDVKIGDQTQRKMSVLFADIRNFTAMSETMTPAENFKFINDFLSRMEPAITEHGGFIDKYIGDAIMALFDGSADDALRAAISMLRTLSRFNQSRLAQDLAPVRLGIGINTGNLMLGTVGGASRMDGTVISDTVNVAARIEQLTKEYAASLLISSQTFLELDDSNDYCIRLVDRVAVRGRSSAISVYEVFDADPKAIALGKVNTRSCFEMALLQYTQHNYTKAAEGFQACLDENPDDEIARLYLQRCTERS
ncbi:MAG: AAA family ATPase [Cyanobacteria bacterium P01_A01_bin.123]